MKKIMFALAVVVLLACACASFAQGAFVDVPTDHWAYDAVNTLQRDGIIIGYPDGTFGGKRAMTRYEFAVAIARLLPLMDGDVTVGGVSGISSSDLNSALAPYAKKSDIPAFSGASKADLDALKRLVNEFGDEIASLGVDVDAMKRDVANLTARVEALEAENRRVRFTGDVTVAAITGTGNVYDLDGYPTNTNGGHMLQDVTVVKDFDLNIVGRVNDKITANATINYGNYLNYYANDITNKDGFYPYYLYIDAALADNANLTVGRFPMQWTPYTIKRTDWDSYVNMVKTDDGNYALDGVKFDYSVWGIDLTMFAAKNDQNEYYFDEFDSVIGSNLTQSAGARATFGLGNIANVGLSYYQAWDDSDARYDQTRVYGADLNIPFGANFAFDGSYTVADKVANDDYNLDNNNDNNDAWDVALSGNWDKFGFKAGYKRVEENFVSAGNWDKVGYWNNPNDIKGYYGELGYKFADNFCMKAGIKSYDAITSDNNLDSYTAGLKWGVGAADTLTADYEYVKYNTNHDDKEQYITLGWAHNFTPNATFRMAYQFINDKCNNVGGYDDDGSRAVAQFSVSF